MWLLRIKSHFWLRSILIFLRWSSWICLLWLLLCLSAFFEQVFTLTPRDKRWYIFRLNLRILFSILWRRSFSWWTYNTRSIYLIFLFGFFLALYCRMSQTGTYIEKIGGWGYLRLDLSSRGLAHLLRGAATHFYELRFNGGSLNGQLTVFSIDGKVGLFYTH